MPSPGSGAWRRSLAAHAALVVAAVAACSEVDTPPTTVLVADSADQVIFGLRHNLTFDGLRRAHLEADTAYYYEGPQTVELRGVSVTFYSSVGAETSTLTSREGTYMWRTGDMEAREDVVAVTPDGRRLTTSVLEYRNAVNQIVGSAPFVFVNSEQRVEGEAFTSDPDFRNVVTTRARGAVGTVERQ